MFAGEVVPAEACDLAALAREAGAPTAVWWVTPPQSRSRIRFSTWRFGEAHELLGSKRLPIDGRRERPHGDGHGALHEQVALHEEGQELRDDNLRVRSEHHRVRGADAFEIGHGELALIRASLSEDDVSRLEPELRGLDVIGRSPSSNREALGVEVLEPHIPIDACSLWVIDTVVHTHGNLAELHALAVRVQFSHWRPPPTSRVRS
jgi:hypothetical protein